MISVGFAAGMLAAWKLSAFRHLDKDHLLNSFILLILGAISGSRILFILINFSYFYNNPWMIMRLDKGGLVFLGGFIGAFLFTYLYYIYNKLNPLEYGDILMAAVALGHSFGRIGCYFNGCCYGRLSCAGEWGVVFPGTGPGSGVLRIPVQLYSSMGNFIIFVLLVLFIRRFKEPGKVMALYMILYPVHRFLIEFLRADNRGGFFLTLSISQWISIIIFISGITLFKILSNKKNIAENQPSD